MKKLIKLAVVSLGLIAVSTVHADQSNLQISPPPIAAPDFKAGQVDKKASVTYVGISGTGLDLNGAGGNFVVRSANSDLTAIDFSAGAFILGGTLKSGTASGDLFFMSIPLSLNFELQPVKTENAAFILFAGPMASLGLSSASFKVAGTTTTSTTTTTLYGVQGGAQMGVKAGDFNISPFAMVQSQQGSATTDTSSGGSSSIDIPSFTTTSYGLDILYTPWNMTLSSMLQEAAKANNDNQGFKTTVISLSWNF